jgi:hypothetical protein
MHFAVAAALGVDFAFANCQLPVLAATGYWLPATSLLSIFCV